VEDTSVSLTQQEHSNVDIKKIEMLNASERQKKVEIERYGDDAIWALQISEKLSKKQKASSEEEAAVKRSEKMLMTSPKRNCLIDS
jgi:hypothetical protein